MANYDPLKSVINHVAMHTSAVISTYSVNDGAIFKITQPKRLKFYDDLPRGVDYLCKYRRSSIFLEVCSL